jgi:hypothetical protein
MTITQCRGQRRQQSRMALQRQRDTQRVLDDLNMADDVFVR